MLMVDSLSCPFMNPYKTFLHCESVFNAKQYFLKRFIHGFLDPGSGNIFFSNPCSHLECHGREEFRPNERLR